MTNRELIEKLEQLPDEAIVCLYDESFGDNEELLEIEYIENEQYYNMENDVKIANIILI